MVVERSSGEETVTSSMRVGLRPSVEAKPSTSHILPVERPSGEVHATDIASGSYSAIRAHPPVDRASTDALETDDALTERRRASRTPSDYRASTETGTEETVPVMNTIAGGPNVDRTLTDTSVDFSSSSRGATWGSYNGRIVHPTDRCCYARFQGREEFRWTG